MTTRRWLKGNTHTHTTYSDGDSPPEVVVDWYAEHGYDFLFLTDHNAVVPESHLARLRQQGLAVWGGEEITAGVVHVNGLGLGELVTPEQTGSYTVETQMEWTPAQRLHWAVEQIRAQGAVPSVNHPNRWRALTFDDLVTSPEFRLLEVANLSPDAARTNVGGPDQPSTEQLWDLLLAAGQRIWAVASDDAHHFTKWGAHFQNPGRGWLMVDAPPDDPAGLLNALWEGRFYASSGIELAEYHESGREIAVELAGQAAQIELVGPDGWMIDAIQSQSARFDLAALNLPYARVRASAANGARLWTQPVFR
jgi:hypothetical protein